MIRGCDPHRAYEGRAEAVNIKPSMIAQRKKLARIQRERAAARLRVHNEIWDAVRRATSFHSAVSTDELA